MKTSKMAQAVDMRYMKIQRLTDLLCNKEEKVVDHLIADGLHEPFHVGKKIEIDGSNIEIRQKRYGSVELLKVTRSWGAGSYSE